MRTLFSHLILMCYCLLAFIGNEITIYTITALLLTVLTVTMIYALQDGKAPQLLLYTYAVIALFFPPLLFFSPFIFPEIERQKQYPCILLLTVSVLYHIGTAAPASLFFLLLGGMLGMFLEYLAEKYDVLETKYKKMQDDSTERNLLLKERNHALAQKQDYEIYNATLRERNRIAREIHDNVGHLLTRCILLNGALQTINRDEACRESLHILQDTLSQAMDNIRSSVHNLHDDSVNLFEKLTTITQDFSFCPVHLEYDLSQDVPGAIRYAFITITQEALTNVSRHSNATRVQITLREHPAMYQLSIQDNGSSFSKNVSPDDTKCSHLGIGLLNMQERVQLLGGIFQIHTENGFQIFASIPKNK